MNLLNYLKPMKTLPNRFSNMAFWRVLRSLKDYIVDAFEYIDSWGQHIEAFTYEPDKYATTAFETKGTIKHIIADSGSVTPVQSQFNLPEAKNPVRISAMSQHIIYEDSGHTSQKTIYTSVPFTYVDGNITLYPFTICEGNGVIGQNITISVYVLNRKE